MHTNIKKKDKNVVHREVVHKCTNILDSTICYNRKDGAHKSVFEGFGVVLFALSSEDHVFEF